MAEEPLGKDDLIIKIPKHIWEDRGESSPNKAKRSNFDILERTGVRITSGERNIEYGETQIQTFTVGGKEYRDKILRLLNNPALYAHTPKILQYIYQMGCDSDGEKRYFASMAVSELSTCFPFIDLENNILSEWAKSSLFVANRSAALALTHMIENSRNERNILNLLRYWSQRSNVRLVNTILLLLYEISKKYPQESLGTIESILLKKEALLLYSTVGVLSYSYNEDNSIKVSWETMIRRIFGLVEELYIDHTLKVIETLYEWFQNRKNSNLAIFASTTFLSVTNVKAIAADEVKRAKTITYLFELWDDKKLPEHHQLQQVTTYAVYSWAKTVLEMEATDLERMVCQQFFHELYQKCASAKQNRLDFHLRKWQNQLQQSGKSSASSPPALNFLSLIPDSKQA